MRLHRTGMALLALCALSAPAARAQMDFGILGGGTFSKLGGADKDLFGSAGENKTRVGFAAGAFVSFGIAHSISLEPEALYVQKGVKAEGSAGKASFRLSYFEIPVLLKLRIPAKGNGSQFSPHLYGGGAVGFKVDCHESVTPTGGTTASMSCENAGDKVKSTDFSIVFGGGMDIGRAILDARYDLGLSKVDDSSSQLDIKNRTLYLLVGWTFRSPR